MKLIKNGESRVLTDVETIKIFKQAGWTEEKAVEKPVEKFVEKTDEDTEVKANFKKNNK